MKKVTVEIPDGKELVFDEGVYKLVDSCDIERKSIFEEFCSDIEALYDKYEERLTGKFSIHATINFTAYRSGNRKKVDHWVSDTSTVDVIAGEECWHD